MQDAPAPDDTLAGQVLKLSGLEDAAPQSPLRTCTATPTCLQLALDLLSDRPVNVEECIDSGDRFIQAAMKSLLGGGSSKLTGTMLAALLCAAPREQAGALHALSQGGVLSFNGLTADVTVRHCRLATCDLASNKRYTGSWVAGRMAGYGHIENADGTIVYRGGFQDNRPHGFGTMMDNEGNVQYEGEFSCGRLHGRGRKTLTHGFVEGVWLADSLTCADGVMQHQDPATLSVVRYSGGFVHNVKHGFGTQTTHRRVHGGDEQDVWVSTYRGYFEANRRTGIGVWASKKHAYLGVWWEDKLCATLQRLDADVARTIPLAHLVQQLKTPHAPVFPDPPRVQRPEQAPARSNDAHTQTECTGDDPRERSAAPPGDAGVRLKLQVYSLCALTGLPRKECAVPCSHPISSLRLAMPHASVFFFRGSLLPLDNSEISLQELCPPSESQAAAVYVIRCPICLKSNNMRVTTAAGHAAFEMLECTACEGSPTACLYCRICAADPKRASNALHRLEKGIQHVTSEHGVKLGSISL